MKKQFLCIALASVVIMSQTPVISMASNSSTNTRTTPTSGTHGSSSSSSSTSSSTTSRSATAKSSTTARVVSSKGTSSSRSTSSSTGSRVTPATKSSSAGSSSGGSSSSSSSSVPAKNEPVLERSTQKFNEVVNALTEKGIDTTELFHVHTIDASGNNIDQDINNVLKTVDTLSAVNNFTSIGTANPGTENVKGAGVVNFNNLFTDSLTDTVNVPVTAEVTNGNTYSVAFSDGTKLNIPCTMDGVLNIPFTKTAKRVTFIIYSITTDPTIEMQ